MHDAGHRSQFRLRVHRWCTVKKALEIMRNALAALGVFFLYLLGHGMWDYTQHAAASDLACVYARCM
ncbi:MAG: hypothetical protein EPN57_20435 [Paraburkholderia sp.]|nr:MAG: hypothetical protein EPN57_20435 [Paraburkholderia sp.]